MRQVGRYQILGELGRGAMGVVYRALDPAIGRPLAIKTIHLGLEARERGWLHERLLREARAAGILSHPGIVAIYDVGEEGELAYIAMELVSGVSLDRLLLGEPPSPETILKVLTQTAAALDYAHKKGIVHRDIKPANLMLDEEGLVKVTDFGVAKITTSQHRTGAGALGTPNYMAPEQIQQGEVDGRADQFSLAVVAYELLTGEKPFPGDQVTTVIYKIVYEPPAPAHQLNPTLSWAAGMVLGRALAKAPGERYASCTEFVSALEAALATKKDWRALPRGASQNLPTAQVTPPAPPPESAAPPVPEAPAPPESELAAAVAPPPAPARPQPSLLWGVIGAVLAGLAVGTAVFWVTQSWLSREPPRQVSSLPAAGAPATRPSPMPPAPAITTPPAESPPAEPPAPEPAKPAEEAPQPAPEAVKPTPEAAKPETGVAEPAPESAKPVPETKPAPPRPPRVAPAPLVEQPIQVITSPPGARIVPDSNAARACRSPCTLKLLPGRHTLAVSLDGFRRELRIFEVTPQPMELFVSLTAATGRVHIQSEPAGAALLVDGQAHAEKTPATLVLPAGKHRLTVIWDGGRQERDITVTDGGLIRVSFSLPP